MYQDQEGRYSRDPDRIEEEEGFDYLYGVSPVLNALTSARREMEEIYVQEVVVLLLLYS